MESKSEVSVMDVEDVSTPGQSRLEILQVRKLHHSVRCGDYEQIKKSIAYGMPDLINKIGKLLVTLLKQNSTKLSQKFLHQCLSQWLCND